VTDAVVRDGLELLFVVAVGGMLWSTVRRLRAGQIEVYRCPACRRPTSRAYPLCTRCGTTL
jgi:ribosomal protein L37AE/L43A